MLGFIWPGRSASLQTSEGRQPESKGSGLITGLMRRKSQAILRKCRRGRSMDAALLGRDCIQNSMVA